VKVKWRFVKIKKNIEKKKESDTFSGNCNLRNVSDFAIRFNGACCCFEFWVLVPSTVLYETIL
jgi:hypothetical protein